MTRYGELWIADQDEEVYDTIVTYMRDDIREDLHMDMCPCSNDSFLRAYCEMDPQFEELLEQEFGIELY